MNCGLLCFNLKKYSKYLTYNHEIMFPMRSAKSNFQLHLFSYEEQYKQQPGSASQLRPHPD